MTLDSGQEELRPALTAGLLPPAGNSLDHEITFGTPLPVVDWATGEQKKTGALLRVQTRPSVLYTRLFAALGDFATGVEYLLLFAAVMGVIGGLLLGFIPGLPKVRLHPELVFLFFLPPLLFPAALFTSWRDFRANLRPILLLNHLEGLGIERPGHQALHPRQRGQPQDQDDQPDVEDDRGHDRLAEADRPFDQVGVGSGVV
jgi:hypothetical protein